MVVRKGVPIGGYDAVSIITDQNGDYYGACKTEATASRWTPGHQHDSYTRAVLPIER